MSNTMSHNSSVRSSFFRKTEEDFREEIMDLKRQLARVKEESKLLKVKLRKSEENAARKEKIICTMIDPLKAHLSAKSMRDYSRLSQDKGSSVKPNIHCQGLCSRSYRHDFKTQMNCNSRTDQQKRKWNKKGDLKVTTLMECLSPFDYKSSKVDLLKSNTCGSCERIPSDGSGETMSRDSVNKMKGRDKTSLSHNRNSGKRKEMNVPKKKRPKNQTENNYDNFDGVSESFSSSLPCNLKGNKRKSKKGLEMKCGMNVSPTGSVICEQCKLRSSQKKKSAPASCSIENLSFEGKTLLSLWNDNGPNIDKQTEIPQVSATLSQDDSCGFSKFGIYLIKEGVEQQGHNPADDTCRQMGGETDGHMINRRKSIFRLDIKKKEPKKENDYTNDMDLYQETELGDNTVVGDDDDFFKSIADLSTEDEDSHGVHCNACNTAVRDCDNIILMDKMMDYLSVIEQPVLNHRKKSDFVNVSLGDEKMTSSLAAKTVDMHADKNKKYDDLYCNGINCRRTPAGGNILIQSEKMLDKRSNLSIHGDLSVNEEAVMLDLILQSGETESLVHSI